jgi:hypothetical protein
MNDIIYILISLQKKGVGELRYFIPLRLATHLRHLISVSAEIGVV